MRPSTADFRVVEAAPPCEPNPASEQCKPVRLVATIRIEQGHGRRASDGARARDRPSRVGPSRVALDAIHPRSGLDVVSDSATQKPAGDLRSRNTEPREAHMRTSVVRAAKATDIPAGPV